MSLVARHLESAGLATVILGSALDIVEHCRVPRFQFTDFPLGNPCGKPFDHDMQRQIVELALRLLEDAQAPCTTRRTPFDWSDDESWRDRYMKVDDDNRDTLREMGERRRRQQQLARETGRARST